MKRKISIRNKIFIPFICIIMIISIAFLIVSYLFVYESQKKSERIELERRHQDLQTSLHDYLEQAKTQTHLLSLGMEASTLQSSPLYQEIEAILKNQNAVVYWGKQPLSPHVNLEEPLLQSVTKGHPQAILSVSQIPEKAIRDTSSGSRSPTIETSILAAATALFEGKPRSLIVKFPFRHFIQEAHTKKGHEAAYFMYGLYKNNPMILYVGGTPLVDANSHLQTQLITLIQNQSPKRPPFFTGKISIEAKPYRILFRELPFRPYLYTVVLMPAQPFDFSTIQPIVLLIVTLGLITGWIIMIYAILIRKITSSIDVLGTVAKEVSRGDLDQKVYLKSRDEIGELSQIFNEMIKNLRESAHNLMKEKNRSEAIITCLPEGVIVADSENRLMLANEKAQELFQFSLNKVQGKVLLEHISNKELITFLKQKFKKAGHIISRDVQLQAREDKPRYYNLTTSLLKDKEGMEMGVITVLRDITHEREIELLRESFLRTVSHELRTPLTSVIGFLELVCGDSNGGMSEEHKRYLAIALQEGRSLQHLIDDLLDLSRINAGTLRLNYETLHVHSILTNVAMALTPLAKGKNLSIIVDPVEKNVPIEADPAKLRQILVNLVSNAIKFTEEGYVKLSFWERGDWVDISVQDTGIGLLQEERERIFEKFQRTDYSSKNPVEGIGLGLSIVKELVTLHKGKIWVESEYQKGATFIFTLPKQQNVPAVSQTSL